jgi:tRNA-modifying protein YgfZ
MNMGRDDNRRMNHPIPATSGVAALADWGVIRARGADAASFLHGQLTSDTERLGPADARLAGYCSAKGRLLASFVVWKAADDELFLACSADLLAATLKRLQMFVLRARCKLSDASGEMPLWGLAGGAATQWLGGAAPVEVWGRGEHDGMAVIRLPDAAGTPRFLAAGGPPPALPPLPLDHWRWLEVRSGVARIERATVEQFVPQMLNYELLGGVDFRKGCYPGQEIVARSQYRGTIKRRSMLFHTAGQAVAGAEVFHSADPGQPAGQVVNAAPQPAGLPPGTLALVEIKLAALGGGSLHLGAPDGLPLQRVELPYALPVEATEPG